MSHELLKDFGIPLSVALIGALVSLLGLIISKESKVSDFRQEWLDGLRADVAALIGHSNAVVAVRQTIKDDSERLRLALAEYRHADEMASRIRLRLNPNNPLHQPLLNALAQHESYFSSPNQHLDTVGIETAVNALVEQTQKLISSVWTHVKKGETTYNISKIGLFVIVVIAVCELLIESGFWLCHHF